MEYVAFDGGRCWSKGVCGNRRVMDLSVIGEKSQTTYGGVLDAEVSLNGTAVRVEHPELGTMVREVGQDALAHSGIHWSPRDRVQTPADQVVLLSHTLRQLNVTGDITLCVGTPAQFYDRDRGGLRELFTREWWVNSQRVNVVATYVMPQPAGAAWHMAVHQTGMAKDPGILEGKVGILDIGEYSTDGGVLFGMKWQGARVVTREVGVSGLKRAVADHLASLGYPKLPYEVDQALRQQGILLEGVWVDLGAVIDGAVELSANTILNEFGAAWRDRPEYDTVIVEGGGAHYFGPRIQSEWHNAKFDLGVPGPEWWNVLGFYAALQFYRRGKV